MKQQIEETVKILKDAHSKISSTLNDNNLGPLRGKLLNSLQQNINSLAMQVGADPIQNTAEITKPLTKMFGKDVAHVKKAAAPNLSVDNLPEERKIPNTRTAKELAGEELKATVTELFPQFLEIETDAIVDTYSDMEIRGVAKMAGLPVTETTPKNADATFVDQIKEAIKTKKEIEAKTQIQSETGTDLTGKDLTVSSDLTGTQSQTVLTGKDLTGGNDNGAGAAGNAPDAKNKKTNPKT